MQQAHVFISGFVQGVGFRQFIKKNAENLGLVGWVRNTEDNRVELVLQGSQDAATRMIGLCKKGPFLSEVKDTEVTWEDNQEVLEEFRIF